jgi:hypothetical protein
MKSNGGHNISLSNSCTLSLTKSLRYLPPIKVRLANSKHLMQKELEESYHPMIEFLNEVLLKVKEDICISGKAWLANLEIRIVIAGRLSRE